MSEQNPVFGQDEEVTVTLTLDDGSEMECMVLNIFPVGDKQYIALLPMDDEDAEESEVFLYRFSETEDGELSLTNIEDDDEFEAVSDAFDEYLDECEFDEMFDEE